MCGWVRVAYVAGVKLLLPPHLNQNLCRCQTERNRSLRKGGGPLGFQICQCVARNADVSWNPLNVDTGSFANGREMRPDSGADWVRLTGRTSGKCCDKGLAVGEDPDAGIRMSILENHESSEAQTHGDSLRTEVQRLKAGWASFRGVQQTVDVDDESGPAPMPGTIDPSVQSSISAGGRRAKADVAAKSRAAGLGSPEEPDREPRSGVKDTPSPLHCRFCFMSLYLLTAQISLCLLGLFAYVVFSCISPHKNLWSDVASQWVSGKVDDIFHWFKATVNKLPMAVCHSSCEKISK